MRNIFFIGIGLFIIMLSSCRSHRQVVQQTSSDSTSVTFREVEKIVHLEGDTVAASMQAVLDQASTGSATEALKFIPQTQIIETKRTSVKIELTKSGEIKATAISKELDEKVTVLEKTISKSKTSLIIEQKEAENWFKKAKRQIRMFLIACVIVLFVATWASLKWGFDPISIIKKLLNK